MQFGASFTEGKSGPPKQGMELKPARVPAAASWLCWNLTILSPRGTLSSPVPPTTQDPDPSVPAPSAW